MCGSLVTRNNSFSAGTQAPLVSFNNENQSAPLIIYSNQGSMQPDLNIARVVVVWKIHSLPAQFFKHFVNIFLIVRNQKPFWFSFCFNLM